MAGVLPYLHRLRRQGGAQVAEPRGQRFRHLAEDAEFLGRHLQRPAGRNPRRPEAPRRAALPGRRRPRRGRENQEGRQQHDRPAPGSLLNALLSLSKGTPLAVVALERRVGVGQRPCAV